MKSKYILGVILLSVLGFAAHAQTVSSCPNATAGPWPANTFLPCTPAVVYLVQPVSPSALVSDMQCTATCVFSWKPASAILPTDQVWMQTGSVGAWTAATNLKIASAVNTASVTIAWNAVTTTVDGTLITSPVTYNVYAGPTNTGLTSIQTGVTGVSTVVTGLTMGSTTFFSVTAVANNVESSQSLVVSYTAAIIPPFSPVDVTATKTAP
jgi:hypothetical protein